MNYGYGSQVLQEQDIGGKREISFNFSLLYAPGDDMLGHYLAQTAIAFDMDIDSGVIIASTGTFKFGIRLIIPKLQIMKIPRIGAAGDYMTEDFECTVMDDGTNDVIRLYVYNAQTAYLA